MVSVARRPASQTLRYDTWPEIVDEALSVVTAQQCAVGVPCGRPGHDAIAARVRAVDDPGVERLAIVFGRREHRVIFKWVRTKRTRLGLWFVHDTTAWRTVAATKPRRRCRTHAAFVGNHLYRCPLLLPPHTVRPMAVGSDPQCAPGDLQSGHDPSDRFLSCALAPVAPWV